DPWGYGNSLEWATSCPPPRHNFTELPRIRSERPAFELHYPHMTERMHAEKEISFTGKPLHNRHQAPSEQIAEATAAGTATLTLDAEPERRDDGKPDDR
ncbi:MAG: hypothetical protein DIU77_005960, partial [Thermocrispum agreste]